MAKEAEAQDSKWCECCGREFYKRPRDSVNQWRERLYCSISCRNKSTEPTPIHLRFWGFVEKKDKNECWLWSGAQDGRGYGTISIGSGKPPLKAHRISWEIHNGPLGCEAVICHRCDTPLCVNPNHLVRADQKENMRQASSRGRLNPKSLLNLRPGSKGFLGAGPKNRMEMINERG